MAGPSDIEWTDASWNPIVGCSIVSPGCTNCYAMRMAARIEAANESNYDSGKGPLSPQYVGTTKRVNGNPVWTGKVALASDDVITAPLHWRKPRRIFVNSMGDLFHESIPDEWIDRVVSVMAKAHWHTYQVLTKRTARMRDYLSESELEDRLTELWAGDDPDKQTWSLMLPLRNVWWGTSAERQQEWDERKEHLRNTPAAVHFASFEPLLGAIMEPRPMSDFIQWAIVGGESGPKARPMHPDWARSIRDQCQAAGVSYFFKQQGEWAPHTPQPGGDLGGDTRAGRVCITHVAEHEPQELLRRSFYPGDIWMRRVGKKAAGRLLDGREHNEFPRGT